jgi:hypothetical protein
MFFSSSLNAFGLILYQGNSQPFNELVNQFNPKHRTDSLFADLSTSLRTWILALTCVVSRLERTHVSLVEAIVNMPWTTLDSATVKSYTVFIGMLVSARPEYLSLVLGKIAQGFTYRGSFNFKHNQLIINLLVVIIFCRVWDANFVTGFPREFGQPSYPSYYLRPIALPVATSAFPHPNTPFHPSSIPGSQFPSQKTKPVDTNNLYS